MDGAVTWMANSVIFILDRSGSMSGLEKDTIGGFNSMIEQQKEKERSGAAEYVRGTK